MSTRSSNASRKLDFKCLDSLLLLTRRCQELSYRRVRILRADHGTTHRQGIRGAKFGGVVCSDTTDRDQRQ